MLTNNLTLTFCSEKRSHDLAITLKDRNNTIINTITFEDDTKKSTTFDLSFPNTLKIKLTNAADGNFSVHLESVKLSGLYLTDQILDQICHVHFLDSDTTLVSRTWNQSGVISIDFFAADWIQYHLLYGNKITKS
jgi:hypothetical protein